MAELIFNPQTEFEIVEEFNFDESIQRPSEIRFFTYEEQAADFMNKLLPSKGKISKGMIREAEYQVDSFTRLYKELIQETPDGFVPIPYSRPQLLPWVHYVNSGGVQTGDSYSWLRWLPLYAPTAGLAPNYYIRLLDSLPKSAFYYEHGEVPVYQNGRTQIDGRYFLDRFQYSKTTRREDKTFRIDPVLREDTQDAAGFDGYSVDNPPIEPPNPLTDHPFLSVHPEPIVIQSTERLPELLPTMTSIFEHAVPETSDPYTVALPYLKIYDIRLKDVPIDLWTSKFPPVVAIDETPPPKDIAFSGRDQDAPPKVLLDMYRKPWFPGISVRRWLANQPDAGMLVAQMLRSEAAAPGVVAIPPPTVFPDGGVIQGTPEECLPTEITDYNDFLTRGVYRAPKCAVCGSAGHGGKICPDKRGKVDYAPGYGCIPLAFIAVEREVLPYSGKLPWTPGTDALILKQHQDALANFVEFPYEMYPASPASTPAAELNEIRKQVVDILSDDRLVPEDQLSDIEDLLHGDTVVLENHIYKSASTGAFLICEHELERLRGSFAKDPAEYLKTWCAKLNGFYVCQYSGERIAEVLEQQDQFDESGHVINRHDSLTKPPASLEHVTFDTALKKLQSLFKSAQPADDIFYLLLTLLQVLPDEDQLMPLIGFARSESDKLLARMAGKKLGQKEQNALDMALAIYGFNAVVVLLQIHTPRLIPRRSFGSQPVPLRGFPRDTADSNDAPLVDALLGALQKTFENYPSTFRGASVVFLRSLLNDRKSAKKIILASLTKQFVPTFKDALLVARDSMDSSVAAPADIVNSFRPEIVRPASTMFMPSDRIATTAESRYECPGRFTRLLVGTAFSYTQPVLPIVDSILPSARAEQVRAPEAPAEYRPTADEVRGRLKIKPGAFPAIQKLVADEERPGMLRTLLLRLFSMVFEESTAVSMEVQRYVVQTRPNVMAAVGDPSLLRDYYKGVLREFSAAVAGSAAAVPLERAFTRDMAVRSLLSLAADNGNAVENLRAREREEFKARLRRMPDAQRDISKTLIDLGLAPYLITKDDREAFMREIQLEEADAEPDNPLLAPAEEGEEQHENIVRDVGEQGEAPTTEAGDELFTDYGDYGDQRGRTGEGEEAEDAAAYNYKEDFGN
jgi:hypothetical protein